MKILALETSCDDTSVSIVDEGTIVLSSVVSSQADLHSIYGGVVPEIAARAHIQNIIPALDRAFTESALTMAEIDCLAVTKGPGLIGSLIVGVNTARVLASLNKKRLIALHHTEGHIYANWLGKSSKTAPAFPLVCLTVSGGHSSLIYMKKHLCYEVIGETHDDSAGEAYDKVAKMLGLGYPGGPAISVQAQKGNDQAYSFPRIDLTKKPSRNSDGFMEKSLPSLDFSFSGLKTAVLRDVRKLEEKNQLNPGAICDLAASFQTCANEILVRNTIRAAKRYKVKTVLLSGGVAANKDLRQRLSSALEQIENIKFYYPEYQYCTDNAAMIGAAAYQHRLLNDFTEPKDLTPDSGLKLISAS